jgi:hypothetical protein
MYFFRQTPLSLKEKYSGIFSNSKKIVTFRVAPAFQVIGDKGYQLTWIIRNDSLFIKNIYPDYNYSWVVKDGKLQYNEDGSEKMESLWGYISADTVRLLVEQFTVNKFKNNLLHVDWITGDFGVIDSYLGPGPGVRYRTGHYRDGREGGFIMTFKNGKLEKMKKDKRKFKN